MGCAPSKIIKKHVKGEMILNNGSNYTNHMVSLKSSTYGVLKFDNEIQTQQEIGVSQELQEVINAWELMEDLEEEEEEEVFIERSLEFPKGVIGNDVRSPLKLLNKIDSQLKVSRFSPLFDPVLIALYEKQLSEEKEQIKRMIETEKSKIEPEPEIKKWNEPDDLNAVVIYTTTLRGIQKTFEECNTVRFIIESHRVRMSERDISMDWGFKEELRKLMGSKEVKVPLVFVKGKLMGGFEEIVKLEKEGKLGVLFDEIPRAVHGCCIGCNEVRFVMCIACNGSCKVLDGELKKMRCGECNENGLIQCPLCC